ncbi:hypothetical protein SRHO_G00056580 [Serrasalmus rhombeus]
MKRAVRISSIVAQEGSGLGHLIVGAGFPRHCLGGKLCKGNVDNFSQPPQHPTSWPSPKAPVRWQITPFRTLAAKSGWNEEALMAVFQQGLNGRLKDELATWELPSMLEGLSDVCNRLNTRMHQRDLDRRGGPTLLPPVPSGPPLQLTHHLVGIYPIPCNWGVWACRIMALGLMPSRPDALATSVTQRKTPRPAPVRGTSEGPIVLFSHLRALFGCAAFMGAHSPYHPAGAAESFLDVMLATELGLPFEPLESPLPISGVWTSHSPNWATHHMSGSTQGEHCAVPHPSPPLTTGAGVPLVEAAQLPD